MEITRVLVKVQPQQTFTLDMADVLQAGENLQSIVAGTLHPLTNPALVAQASVAGTTVTVHATDGVDGISYGVPYTLSTTMGRQLIVTVVISYTTDTTGSGYLTDNPSAYQSLVGSIKAGDAAIGHAYFVLDAGVNATQGYVTWELLDAQGRIYSSGNAYSYTLDVTQFNTMVIADAVIHVPSTLLPTIGDQSYQVRWALRDVPALDAPPQYMSESVTVLGAVSVPIGAVDLVEMQGDVVVLQFVTDRPATQVTLDIYKDNAKLIPSVVAQNPKAVASGWLYEVSWLATVAPSLDPLTVVWGAKYANAPGIARTQAHLFVVSPMMLNAMTDVQQCVMKARTTLRQDSDYMFDSSTVMTWLRRGRDFFNGAAGVLTDFDMTEASGPLREFWLRYSEVAALQAQALAEGEKSFDFQGADISLNVDHSQFYDSLADKLLQSVADAVSALKNQLAQKGVNGGSGNLTGVMSLTSPGFVGVGYNPISPRRFGGQYSWRPST